MSIFITLNNLPIQNSNYIIFIGNELTWSSTGIIYVDETSIPNSNIFELFPYLFRAKRPKGLIGFEDFCDKIVEMGLVRLCCTYVLTDHRSLILDNTGINNSTFL